MANRRRQGKSSQWDNQISTRELSWGWEREGGKETGGLDMWPGNKPDLWLWPFEGPLTVDVKLSSTLPC